MLPHLEPLIKNSLTRKYNADSTIINQGEVPKYACVLVEGLVSVFSISPQGDNQIVIYHVPGEFFPTAWIFGKSSNSLFFYEAVEDCTVAFIPREQLISFMLNKPEKMHAMLDYFTTNFAASMIRVNALQQPRARDKLLYTMYYLAQRYGNLSRGPHIRIPFNLTHQSLANLVGLTRETAATEMNRLKKEGILDYSSQTYTININKVLELIDEDSFKDINIPI